MKFIFFIYYMLQHFSPFENHESIIKEGWLKSGYKEGLYGKKSKWIYVRINTEINQMDSMYDFLIDESVLLHTKFILHTGWYSEDYKCNEIIDGTQLTKYKLKKILEKFKEICKLNYELKKIIHGKNMFVHHSNEILIKEDIDLHKYLVAYNGNEKLIEYIKINYPKVKNMYKK